MSNTILDLNELTELNEAATNGQLATLDASADAITPPPASGNSFTGNDIDLESPEDAALAAQLPGEDQSNLRDFNVLLDMLRTRTRSVADGYQNGTYIVGRPGTGKTHTIAAYLDTIVANYIVKNAKMTAPGLWELMHENREKIIVLDDIASLYSERPALQLLLAALGGSKGGPRLITYTTAEANKGRRSFEFSGGIIAISNVPLRHDPLARAVASRIPMLEHEPTDDMVSAFMRFQALKGYKNLMPVECSEVVEFVITAARASEMRVDLRSMTQGWEDFRQCKEGKALCSWQTLVLSSMKQMSVGPTTPITRKQVQEEEQIIAASLFQKYPGVHDTDRRNEEWKEKTGKSADTLLRHGRLLKGAGKL